MGRDDLTTRKQLTLTLDIKVVDYLRDYSKKTDVPIARFIDRLVFEAMEREDNKKEAQA